MAELQTLPAEPASRTLNLEVYGARVAIHGDGGTLDRLAKDFSYFVADADAGAAPAIEIVLTPEPPRYDNLPPLRASLHTPRNVCYTDGSLTYMDYFGRALAVYDRERERVEVWTDQPHLRHEIAYLTLLSRLGERFDRQGLHRVHALSVACHGRAALILLPSTGGKTTLALHFLQAGGDVRLVSEDSPLVDRHGLLHPFPLRLGILTEEPPPFPAQYLTYAERMEFTPKYLVSLDAFPGAIEDGATYPAWLFIGRRTFGRTCRIAPTGRRRGFAALLRDMVVGVGLYQGVEFLLRSSLFDLTSKASLAFGRLRAAVALLRRVEVFEIDLGLDTALNAATLHAFLNERWATRPSEDADHSSEPSSASSARFTAE